MLMASARQPSQHIWQAIGASARRAASAWNGFWLTPADPAPLCLLRVLTGGMLFYSTLVWGLDLTGLLGPDGWNSAELIQHLQRDTWALSFWWYVPERWTTTAHFACLFIAALFWVGCWTRLTSILAFAIHVSYCNRAQLSDYGLDQILGIVLLYLLLGPSGVMYSLDSLRRRKSRLRTRILAGETDADLRVRASVSAGLALRLIQVHYCVIYFFSGVSKLQGRTWWTGEALWRAFANYEYQSTNMTWLAAYPWVLQLMTVITLAWEISFAYLIWNRTLRPVMLTIGVMVHFGIGLCMGMWTFGLMMIFGYVAFCDADMTRWIGNRLFGLLAASPLPKLWRKMSWDSTDRTAWQLAWNVGDRPQLRHSSGRVMRLPDEPLSGVTRAIAGLNTIALAPEPPATPVAHETMPAPASHVTSVRQSLVYVHPDAPSACSMVDYFNLRGFNATHVSSLDGATRALFNDDPSAIICNAKVAPLEAIERFHAEWKNSGLQTILCYVLGPDIPLERQQLFESHSSVVLKSPVSYRDIRLRLQQRLEALAPGAFTPSDPPSHASPHSTESSLMDE